MGLVLNTDSFSAALAMGLQLQPQLEDRSLPFSKKEAIRFALIMAGVEVFVTLLSIVLGQHSLAHWNFNTRWISFFLLGGVAVHMVSSALQPKKTEAEKINFHSLSKIWLVSVVTSLDAIAVGLSVGLSKEPVLPVVISIGIFALLSVYLGLHFAWRLSKRNGPAIEIVGALLMMALALKSLWP